MAENLRRDLWQLTYTDPPHAPLWAFEGTRGFLTLMRPEDEALIDVVPGVGPDEVDDASWELLTEWLEPDDEPRDLTVQVFDPRCLPSDLEAWLLAQGVDVVGPVDVDASRRAVLSLHPSHMMAIDLFSMCEARYVLLPEERRDRLLMDVLDAMIDSRKLPIAYQAFCTSGYYGVDGRT